MRGWKPTIGFEWSRLVAILLCGFLTGCVGAYVPPASGPTAVLHVTLHNQFGLAIFDTVPSEHALTGERRIIRNGFGKPPATATVVVLADRRDLFVYMEAAHDSNDNCSIDFSFTPSAALRYELYFGDVPPPPPTTVLGRVFHFRDPVAGGRCFIRLGRILPDGTFRHVPFERWHPGL